MLFIVTNSLNLKLQENVNVGQYVTSSQIHFFPKSFSQPTTSLVCELVLYCSFSGHVLHGDCFSIDVFCMEGKCLRLT